ncbi:MAG: hypothetical protein A4E31_00235 [Methanomassiliicoccales archaeon PtaU1.Bin030]|nr:MAG: hypothetical protein A4E31_00235 [Methanomassiliicoccales archaeon PtaU1.Bin030]
MIVRITSPKTDKLAQGLLERFRADGFCPFGDDNILIGFIKEAEEEDENIILTIEVTNPSSMEYFCKLAEQDEPQP